MIAMRMKDSGIEWIGEIPEDWDVRKISLIFKTIGSGTTPPTSNPEYFDGDFCWINTGDLNDSELYSCEKTITQKALQDCSALKLFPSNSLIIAMYGATIGKLCITRMVSATNQACCVLSQPIAAEIKYVFYWLLCGRERIISLALGGGQPNISQDLVRSLRLAMPSFDMQQRIAAYLDSRCAEIDAVIAAKQRQNDLLKEQRQSVIFEAVTKGLDPTVTYKDSGVEWIGVIPEGWEAFKIKHIVAVPVTDGPHESPQLVDEGIPFISAEAVKGNKLDFSLMRGYISKEDHEVYCKKVRPQREDIFVVKSGATTGAIAIVDTDEEFSIWSPLAMVRSKKPEYIQRFVYYAMLSDSFRKQIELGWNFGTQQNLGMNVLENLYIACPLSTSVQQQIADYLDIRCAELDRVVAANNAVIDKLKEYRQSLIYEAVTGKIAV